MPKLPYSHDHLQLAALHVNVLVWICVLQVLLSASQSCAEFRLLTREELPNHPEFCSVLRRPSLCPKLAPV